MGGRAQGTTAYLACAHGVKVALLVKMRMEGPRGGGKKKLVLDMFDRRCPLDV